MWNSENDDLEEEDNPNPVICPMCRETVLRFRSLSKLVNFSRLDFAFLTQEGENTLIRSSLTMVGPNIEPLYNEP